MRNTVQIVMATFNGARFVREQLTSILSQTHKDIQLIIRDDASTDETPAIIEEFAHKDPQRFNTILGTNRLGTLGNFADGLSKAESDYVMFSDSDDVWLPDKVEKTLAKMRAVEQEIGSHAPVLIHTD